MSQLRPLFQLYGLDRCYSCYGSDKKCLIESVEEGAKCFHCYHDGKECKLSRFTAREGRLSDFTWNEITGTSMGSVDNGGLAAQEVCTASFDMCQADLFEGTIASTGNAVSPAF